MILSGPAAGHVATPIPTGDLPTYFNFRHPEIRRAGAVFVRDAGRATVLKMAFGDLRGSLPLDRLAASFALPPHDPDRALLQMLPAALRFRREVRAGDPVPSEILDGRPSWTPRPHVIQRAVGMVWRALRAPLEMLDQTPEPLSETDGGDRRRLARALLGLVPGVDMVEAEARLEAVTLDLARVDWLNRAVSALQRMVGEMAQFSSRHATDTSGDLARRCAIQLREVAIWGTAQAMTADSALADVNRLLSDPTQLERGAWPLIALLRTLALDIEPAVLLWQDCKARQDGPRLRDFEDLLRLVSQRYGQFDPSIFQPPMPLALAGVHNA